MSKRRDGGNAAPVDRAAGCSSSRTVLPVTAFVELVSANVGGGVFADTAAKYRGRPSKTDYGPTGFPETSIGV